MIECEQSARRPRRGKGNRPTTQIASELRVSEKSVRDWRRKWTAGGTDALASAGPGGSDCKLSVDQQKELAEVLDDGPVTQGWDDARWTLARVADVIERRFEVTYSLRGVSHLLHRMGYSLQVPTVGRSNAIRKRSPVGIAGGGRR
ncbi:winged helix-turn-helix domain-containing protein [Micromonospora sp. U56]|uniref:winged helix-turn-helix domain-containing protein n=1 Tax=Micromonospora sp. U56 TaxID=2824900 RepID=UPI0035A85878